MLGSRSRWSALASLLHRPFSPTTQAHYSFLPKINCSDVFAANCGQPLRMHIFN